EGGARLVKRGGARLVKRFQESAPIIKGCDEKQFSEYRTKRQILEFFVGVFPIGFDAAMGDSSIEFGTPQTKG
ncbi:MAG: hypothetical protein ACYCU8_12065, partial [Ferrimicrobium acidiphilum]